MSTTAPAAPDALVTFLSSPARAVTVAPGIYLVRCEHCGRFTRNDRWDVDGGDDLVRLYRLAGDAVRLADAHNRRGCTSA